MIYYGDSILTGRSRLRRGLFGRLVMQVETNPGGWIDATYELLDAIGFDASSAIERQRVKRSAPPRDWYADDVSGRCWN